MIDLAAVVARAMTLIGLPYKLGGRRADPSLRSGLDCSEFTAYAYEAAGTNLPWNAQAQYNLTQPVTLPQPGDLVFFRDTAPGDPISHVGIYLGGGRMINAQDSGVAIANLNTPYWQQHFVRFGRVPGVNATDPPGAQTAPPDAGPVGLPAGTDTGTPLGLPNPAAGLGAVSDALGTIVGKLTARDTYIRLALVILGGAALVGGALYAVSQTEAGGAVIAAAGSAAKTAGKAAVLA